MITQKEHNLELTARALLLMINQGDAVLHSVTLPTHRTGGTHTVIFYKLKRKNEPKQRVPKTAKQPKVGGS